MAITWRKHKCIGTNIQCCTHRQAGNLTKLSTQKKNEESIGGRIHFVLSLTFGTDLGRWQESVLNSCCWRTRLRRGAFPAVREQVDDDDDVLEQGARQIEETGSSPNAAIWRPAAPRVH